MHLPTLLRTAVSLCFAAVVLSVAAAPAAAAPTAGVHAHLLWNGVSSDDVKRELDVIKSSGAGVVRVDVGWSSLEQDGKGKINSWYLKKIDTVVAEAEARGLRLLLTFWETPCWASTAPSSVKQNCEGSWWSRDVQRYPPRDASEYANALAFLVDRYGSRVAAWEVWNEPNLQDFFKSDNPVRDYAALVRAAYPAAKRAHPNAQVIAGALADADFEFTDALFRHGIKDKFDAYSIHPYSGDRSPLDRNEDKYIRYSFVRGVPKVRETLQRNGDAEPLWLTEFGWSTCNVRGQESYKNCVSESTQANYLTKAFSEMATWSYVDAGIVYNHRDRSTDMGDRVDNYGLLRYSGSKKPSFTAFKASATALRSAEPLEPSRSGGDRPELTLEAKATNDGIVARGSTSPKLAVRIRAYRYSRAHDRFAQRPAHDFRVTARSSGRYRGLIRKSALRRGLWKVKAKLPGFDVPAQKDRVRWDGSG